MAVSTLRPRLPGGPLTLPQQHGRASLQSAADTGVVHCSPCVRAKTKCFITFTFNPLPLSPSTLLPVSRSTGPGRLVCISNHFCILRLWHCSLGRVFEGEITELVGQQLFPQSIQLFQWKFNSIELLIICRSSIEKVACIFPDNLCQCVSVCLSVCVSVCVCVCVSLWLSSIFLVVTPCLTSSFDSTGLLTKSSLLSALFIPTFGRPLPSIMSRVARHVLKGFSFSTDEFQTPSKAKKETKAIRNALSSPSDSQRIPQENFFKMALAPPLPFPSLAPPPAIKDPYRASNDDKESSGILSRRIQKAKNLWRGPCGFVCPKAPPGGRSPPASTHTEDNGCRYASIYAFPLFIIIFNSFFPGLSIDSSFFGPVGFFIFFSGEMFFKKKKAWRSCFIWPRRQGVNCLNQLSSSVFRSVGLTKPKIDRILEDAPGFFQAASNRPTNLPLSLCFVRIVWINQLLIGSM